MIAAILIASCLAVTLVGAQPFGPPVYRTEINGFLIGDVTTLGTPRVSDLSFRPEHFAVDLKNPGFIVYADQSELLTYKPSTGQLDNIAGKASTEGYVEGVGMSARFRQISGFVQLGADKLITVEGGNNFLLPNRGNDCVREVNRWTNTTSLVAGTCGRKGFVDGSFEDALFDRPRKIIRHPYRRNLLYVSDEGNKAIREINLVTRRVSTFFNFAAVPDFSEGNLAPLALVIDPFGAFMYTSAQASFGKINMRTRQLTILRARPTADEQFEPFRDGPLARAGFAEITVFEFLGPHTILAADGPNQRLRIIDLVTDSVSSVCCGCGNDLDGDLRTCDLRQFSGLELRADNSGVIFSSHRGFSELSLTQDACSHRRPAGHRGWRPCYADSDCPGYDSKCCPSPYGRRNVCSPVSQRG